MTARHYTNSQNSMIYFGYLCWFLGKNLSNFVPPAWKLNNPYYHTQGHHLRRQRSRSRSCQRGRSRDRIQNRDKKVSMTRKFAEECTELLEKVPRHRLLFERFMPAYLKYFKRQCRVADYGFTKLIEMFEAIPNTVQITMDCNGKRVVQLDQKYLYRSSDSSHGYGSTGCWVFKQGVQN